MTWRAVSARPYRGPFLDLRELVDEKYALALRLPRSVEAQFEIEGNI